MFIGQEEKQTLSRDPGAKRRARGFQHQTFLFPPKVTSPRRAAGWFLRTRTHINTEICPLCIIHMHPTHRLPPPLGTCMYKSMHCVCVRAQSLSCVRFFATHELQPARLLCPWGLAGKNTGLGCHFLLWGIFPTQELSPRLGTACIGRQSLYH